MWDLVALAGGIFGLWIGTSWTLASTLRLGDRYGFSQIFLGLTVLAIGTDLPELVVAIDGALLHLRGVDASGVVVGNAVGSAIAQGSVVLGVACLAGSLDLARSPIRRDGWVLAGAIALLAVFGADGSIDRVEGALLCLAYGTYLVFLLRGAAIRDHGPSVGVASQNVRDAAVIALGLLVVAASAELVLRHAVVLAERWELSQGVIGVFLVGLGTSLPEFSISVGAVVRGKSALSLGNVIGSNVFDILVPVGVSGAIHPLGFERDALRIDLVFVAMLTASVLVWAFRGALLGRRHALFLFAAYALYAGVRLTR